MNKRMNIAIIFAGGVGKRMHSGATPKQFLELQGKPILVYTLEHFQHSKDIDGIILVSVADWIPYCNELIARFYLDKVKAVVEGGTTGFMSIDNGLKKAVELYSEDSVVLIHDGVRPLINQRVISDCIASVRESGSAITVSPATETMIIKDENGDVGRIFDRSACQVAKAPQCFVLKDIVEVHKKAVADGFDDFIDSACLMNHYGYKLHTVTGPADNIKITTPADFFVFRAFLEARKNSEIFGV